MLVYIEDERLIINTDQVIRAHRETSGGIKVTFADCHSEMIYYGADEFWQLLLKDASVVQGQRNTKQPKGAPGQ
jgi:hypothetical protein